MLYFNYAGLGPTRPEASEEQARVQAALDPMLFSEKGVDFYLAQLDASRTAVAKLLQPCDPNDIAFVQNASVAVGIMLSSVELQKGDTIVTSDQEHPSVTAPLQVLAAKGINVLTLQSASPEALVTHLDDICGSRRVRLVIISHVSYKDGRVLPIEKVSAVAKAHDAFIVVDGAQAVGHIPVRLGKLGVDAYFFSGHKWCFGPMGTGAMYVTKTFLAATEPLWVGWAAKTAREKLLAKRLEIGTQNIGLVAGLAKACELKGAEMVDTDRLRQHREMVMRHMHQRTDLDCIGWAGDHAPAILSFSSRRGVAPNDIVDYLFQRHKIVVKPIDYPEEPSCVRLSWSSLTTKDDIIHLLARMDECLEQLA